MTTTASFTIEIDGSPLPATLVPLLVSAYVDSSLRLPDCFELRFRDPGRLVLSTANCRIGSAMRISILVGAQSAATPLIRGEVTALEAEFDTAGTFTVIRGYDAAHRLFRGRRTASYCQVTAADVVRKVAARAGLTTGSIASAGTVFDHLTQSGTTDWQFLDGLARDGGYELTMNDGKLDFGKAQTAADAPVATGRATDPLVLELGSDLVRFRSAVTAAEQVSEVQVRGWDVASKKALVGIAPAMTTTAVLDTVTPAALAQTFGSPVYVATDTPYGTQAQVDAAAGALAEQIAGAFAEFEGVARGNPKIRANTAISIAKIGPPFDGKYTVTTARHRFEPSTGYTTAFAVTGRQERSLFGLTSSGGGHPCRAGVVIGQVSDVKDPQGQGRVTLTFPWLSEDYVSDWARTLQPGAGKDRGAMVVPEVGDEVLVAFEQGDPGRPFVLGGLFNGVDTPNTGGAALIDSISGAINRRSLVSRRGHRIDLLDAAGHSEGVTITTSDQKLQLLLDVTGTRVTVHADGTVLVQGTQGVRIDAGSKSLELTGGSIAINATNGVTIDGGGGDVSVTAGTRLSLKGANASLEGSSQAALKGGGLAAISGALVTIN